MSKTNFHEFSPLVQQLVVKTLGEKRRMKGSGLRIGITGVAEVCGVVRESIRLKKAEMVTTRSATI